MKLTQKRADFGEGADRLEIAGREPGSGKGSLKGPPYILETVKVLSKNGLKSIIHHEDTKYTKKNNHFYSMY
jgi:hypothetical protein